MLIKLRKGKRAQSLVIVALSATALFGIIADRRNAGWMAGAGAGLAGLGLSVAGLLPGYGAVWCAILASGLGVAMFHPAAGKAARQDAGESATAMSLFAAPPPLPLWSRATVIPWPALTKL